MLSTAVVLAVLFWGAHTVDLLALFKRLHGVR
jgi:hypothetical protein